MAEDQHNDLDPQNRITQPDAVTAPLQADAPTLPVDSTSGVPAEGKSRRDFLRAAVIASTAVVATGAAAGVMLATGSGTIPLAHASGPCPLEIQQGAKLGFSNMNDFLQIHSSDVTQFGSAPSGSGDQPITFTLCGTDSTIYFSLHEKNTNFTMVGKLVETGGDNSSHSYVSGTDKNFAYLGYTDLAPAHGADCTSTGHEYPSKSCLTLSCTPFAADTPC